MSFTNQTTTGGRAMTRMIAIVAGLATMFALSAAASAAVLLSGGDAGEGYKPFPIPVYAFNVGTSFDTSLTTAQSTVQGVEFTGWNWPGGTNVPAPGNPNVTMTIGPTSFNISPASYGAGANDAAMTNLLNSGIFSSGSGITLTLGGLNVGQMYRVDILVETNGDSRIENFTFAGATTPTDFFTATAGNGYDFSAALTPDALGRIVVTLPNGPGANNPFLNAFSVTTPEPASLGLLASGGLLLVRRRSTR